MAIPTEDCLFWFPFDVKDWIASLSVRLMTRAQRSMYLDLLCTQWMDGYIPASLEDLGALLNVSMDEIEAAWPRIGKMFKHVEGDPSKLVNERMELDRAKQLDKRDKAIAAVNKRWANVRNTSEDTSVLQPNVHTESDTETEEPKGSSAPKKSNAALLFELLPVSHQTDQMRDAIASYFAMRKANKRMGRLADVTVASRAKEYGTYPVDAVVAALKDSAVQGYQGVFPEKFQKGIAVVQGGAPSSTARVLSEEEKKDIAS